jgi:hypothetical protein
MQYCGWLMGNRLARGDAFALAWIPPQTVNLAPVQRDAKTRSLWKLQGKILVAQRLGENLFGQQQRSE